MKNQKIAISNRNLIAIQMAVPTATAWVMQSGQQSWKGNTLNELITRIQSKGLSIDHVSLCFQLDLDGANLNANEKGTP